MGIGWESKVDTGAEPRDVELPGGREGGREEGRDWREEGRGRGARTQDVRQRKTLPGIKSEHKAQSPSRDGKEFGSDEGSLGYLGGKGGRTVGGFVDGEVERKQEKRGRRTRGERPRWKA